jgi:hypothetical protein
MYTINTPSALFNAGRCIVQDIIRNDARSSPSGIISQCCETVQSCKKHRPLRNIYSYAVKNIDNIRRHEEYYTLKIGREVPREKITPMLLSKTSAVQVYDPPENPSKETYQEGKIQLVATPMHYKASRVIDALVKTESTKGASSPGCIVVGIIVYPFGSGSRTISHDISLELT